VAGRAELDVELLIAEQGDDIVQPAPVETSSDEIGSRAVLDGI